MMRLCHADAMMGESAAAPTQTGRGRSSRQQRAWYWYDWANSAYVTTTATVLFSPYLTAVATAAACPDAVEGESCQAALSVAGLPISPGAIAPYTITVSTILAAVVVVLVGAVGDRSRHPHRLLGGFAWAGSAAASAMFFVAGSNWQLGVALLVVGNVCLASSLVIYDALLNRVATANERDRVSARGWAMGYLGGGLLLAANFALDLSHEALGLDRGITTRISLLSAGVWWAAFTIIPVLGLRRITGAVDRPAPTAGVVGGSLTQLRATFRDLRRYPQTLLFLVAYLFFNDGIQTVIANSSLYGIEELGFSQSVVLGLFLLVQFVAFLGAMGFGRIAARLGAWRTVHLSLGLWTVIVVAAFFVPERALVPFVLLGVAIGLVLGGSQALSRSAYSQLVPRGREAEYFSFYQAMERGTSWFGTLTFGVVYQLTSSYRWSLVALVAFFVVGGVLLSRVDMRAGILAAGNEVPQVV